MPIQSTATDLKQAEEFCRKCLLNRQEIEKLFECNFFSYETGRILVDKANGKIREIDKPVKTKWNK